MLLGYGNNYKLAMTRLLIRWSKISFITFTKNSAHRLKGLLEHVKDPYCLHNVSEKGRELAILNGYLLRKYEIWKFSDVLMRFLLMIPKSLWILAVTGDLEAAKRQALTYMLTMKGWLAYSGEPVECSLWPYSLIGEHGRFLTALIVSENKLDPPMK